MSLHRVAQQLALLVEGHERGSRDGYEPVAEAHRVLGAIAAEDLAAVEAAIDGESVIEKTLRAELDAVRAERDEARAQIGDVRASISAHKIRVATDERDAAIDRAECAEAGLAALRDAAEGFARAMDMGGGTVLRFALADTAQAAEAYTRRVRAEALREAESEVRAADDIGDGGGSISAALEQVADRLRARADEIEGGR